MSKVNRKSPAVKPSRIEFVGSIGAEPPEAVRDRIAAFDRWTCFEEGLRLAAALARKVAEDLGRGHFDDEAADAAIVLALDAVSDGKPDALRGDASSGYAISREMIAWAVAKRLLG